MTKAKTARTSKRGECGRSRFGVGAVRTQPLAMGVAIVVLCAGLVPSAFADPNHASAAAKPVYDESADARQDVAAAVRHAGFENQRVLLVIGANWCGWCTLLHHLFEQDKSIQAILGNEYQVVNIDIGRGEKNQELLTHYGIKA